MNPSPPPPTSTVIQSYRHGLSGVRAANPEVRLTLGKDPARGGQPVLLVDYPGPGTDPAGREVWCDVESPDWTGARAISFHVKAAHALRLSVSFVDRNGVAYTAWTELPGGEWHSVELPFDAIRPNPYFQPPSAKTGAPLDISKVTRLGFAPQDPGPGHLVVSRIVVKR